ncbi:endopeptidase La [Deferribacter autotrophicus]|uniref:Lon protease n=1 Tax=Deferribacter autotrophicus TaxID=500465 RepID=A0A5A8F8B6_9BACT|nr:endopeptidase La [Deferribacter autotrophicus]KAA0258632.1 endopeptidase La [Deferribacter autotrophicus]
MAQIEQYPLIPLRDLVVFPYMIVPVFVGRPKSVSAVKVAEETDKRIFLTLQKDSQIDKPKKGDIYEVGVVAEILQVLKLPDNTIKILVEGVKRARIVNYIDDDETTFVEVEELLDEVLNESVLAPLKETLLKTFEEYMKISKKIPADIYDTLKDISDLNKLVYLIASNLQFRLNELQTILDINIVEERAEKLIEILQTEIEIAKIDERIKHRVKAQMSKAQREYYLNEQIKAIQKELGRDDDLKADLEELESKIKSLDMPDEVREKAERELKKLKIMPPMSAESTVVRNYLDWLTSLPWGIYTEDKIDIKKAEEILDRDHYGLEKVKERILEFLAVRKVSPDIKGPILCFVGPPGVGKTSLAKSIAESLGRKFVRISLGGVRDEAEIRGHRRTYIGALPGKLIQSMRKAKSMNPVFLLDEIDKLGSDFRGDPASALLEALDPEQNSAFMDHYLEVEFDLSKVFFITTANTTETIPSALLDRMEVIQISGYTESEKFNIAKKFLIPKQLKEHSIEDEKIKITDSAIYNVIWYYTREAGVRNLEREIAALVRKGVKKLVSNEKLKQVVISAKNIEKYLGVKKFRVEEVEEDFEVGVATGLAWTPYGGEILQTEVAIFDGNGKMTITGQIGEVMQESAQAALTVVKSRAGKYGIPDYKFKDFDMHIHVPEGAVPKDGPSAGITIATAIMSALTDRPVNCRIAMTGEITLRGKVLPVGGIKEKVLAAHRAKLKDVILPEENKKDLTDIPSDVKENIRFHLVKNIDEVFKLVLKK